MRAARVRPALRGALVGLVLPVLAVSGANAQEDGAGFHLFASEPERGAASGELTLGLDTLPGWPDVGEVVSPAPPGKPKKRFWIAAAEVMGVNLFVYLNDRYLLKAPWAVLSTAVWRENLRQGFHWDNDDFPTNQALHPYHGGFYFEAARSNGFNFWESSLFPVAGSLLWEYFGENQLPSTNDLLNTSLGGPTVGEVSHRVATMILDNTASGSTRFFRELGAFVVDPLLGLNRLFRGEMTRDFPNPDDRFPARHLVEVDLGYEHLGYGNRDVVPYPDQSLVSILVRYGDPFLGENRQPFDFFEAVFEFGPPSGKYVLARRWMERGQLASWQLSQSGLKELRLGVFMSFDYRNNQVEVFSAQSFSANLLLRSPLGNGVDVYTELAGVFYPITAIQSDYSTENFAAVGRPYDYGLGGGARARARIQRESLDLFLLDYEVVWSATRNGLSVHSTIQSLRAEGRLPLTEGLALGGGCTWNKRIISYVGLPTVEVQGPQWRMFAAILTR